MSCLRRISSNTSLAGRVGHVIESLADSLFRIRASGDVEQALVRFGVLHDGRSLPLDGEHYRALAFFSCFMTSPERRRKVVSDWMGDYGVDKVNGGSQNETP